MLGAHVQTITPKEMRRKGFQAAFNIVETVRVDPGSPAARGGLRPGMVVTNVNGEMMSGASDFPSSGKRGDTFRLTVIGETGKLIQIMDHDFE